MVNNVGSLFGNSSHDKKAIKLAKEGAHTEETKKGLTY